MLFFLKKELFMGEKCAKVRVIVQKCRRMRTLRQSA